VLWKIPERYLFKSEAYQTKEELSFFAGINTRSLAIFIQKPLLSISAKKNLLDSARGPTPYSFSLHITLEPQLPHRLQPVITTQSASQSDTVWNSNYSPPQTSSYTSSDSVVEMSVKASSPNSETAWSRFWGGDTETTGSPRNRSKGPAIGVSG